MTAPLTPSYNRANVLTGMARMFYQPYDAEEPPVYPADTVLLGGAWPSPWVPIGATSEGVTIAFARETTDITIEEQPNPLDVRTQTLGFNINTILAEDTLETMILAFGGGEITATAAGVATWGYSDLVIADEMADFSIGLEGRNANGFPRRWVIPVLKSVAQAEIAYRRVEKRMYSVTTRSLSPLSDCPIHNVTTEPTGP